MLKVRLDTAAGFHNNVANLLARRKFTQDSQYTHTGLTEDPQRTHRGLAEDSQRIRRELAEDPHRGFTKVLQRTCPQRLC